jgi:hypothetical protein
VRGAVTDLVARRRAAFCKWSEGENMSTTIELTKAIVGHDGPIRQIVLREPTARDLFQLGEPFAYARNPDGTLYSAENTEAIKAYIERLIDADKELLIGQMSLADGMRVKEAVLSFFTTARLQTSSTTATSSSST